MSWSLREKIIFLFLLVIIIASSLTAFWANKNIKGEFSHYLNKRQENYSESLANSLAEIYEQNGSWKGTVAHLVIRSGIRQGYLVRLLDKDKQAVEIINKKGIHHSYMMTRKMYYWHLLERETEQVKVYPILAQGKAVGYLETRLLSGGILAEQNYVFLTTLNQSLFFSTLIAFFLAALVGLFFSIQLTKPLGQLAFVANKIKDGNLSARFAGPTFIQELDSLSLSLNSLADSLEKQEMLRKRLTADVAHELRTPLATLQSHLEAIIDGVWQPSKERMESCHQEVLRLSRLVTSLEQLNQIENDILHVDLEKTKIKYLLETIITNFQCQYEGKGVELQFLCLDNPWLCLDKDKFTQIMVNLLANALKFTPAQGQVIVTAKEEKEKVIIEVKDNGEGIAPFDLPHVFQRLYRGEKSRSRQTGGAGIGLAITKALVQAQNGQISVSSILGEGSIFSLVFPKMREE